MNEHLIAFIKASNPAALSSLRQQHPEAGDLLTVETKGMKAPKPVDRKPMLELVTAGVKEMGPKIEEVIGKILERMKKVNDAKLVGAVLTIIGGALTALLPAFGAVEVAVTAIVGAVTMLSGLAVLFADQFQQAPSGVKIATIEEHAKLVEARIGVDRIKRRLDRDGVDPIALDDLRTMLEDLDKYAADLLRLSFSGA